MGRVCVVLRSNSAVGKGHQETPIMLLLLLDRTNAMYTYIYQVQEYGQCGVNIEFSDVRGEEPSCSVL